MSTSIQKIRGREILDSRGNPTVEVEVWLEDGSHGPGRASPRAPRRAPTRPSSSATATRRATSARASSRPSRTSTSISPKSVTGLDALDQARVDRAMLTLDGTPNKSKLGANAILGVSLAVARAAADAKDMPLYRYLGGVAAKLLPVPMFNILNGGVHANWQSTDLQEFMIAPVGAPNFREALRWGSRDLPRPEERPQGPGLLDGRRRRGRLRPGLQEERRCGRDHPQGHREGRLQARRGHRHLPRPRGERLLRGRPLQPADRETGRSRPRRW